MLRTFNLDIAPRPERNALSFRHPQFKLFDKRGFVIVGDNFAFPFFNAENLLRQFNFHVLAHRDLTGQTAALFRLTLGDVRQLSGQNIATTFFHLYAALPTGATATAGRRDEDAVAGKRIQQFIAGWRADLVLRFIVDIDNDIAGIHQLRARHQNQPRQHQYNQREHRQA